MWCGDGTGQDTPCTLRAAAAFTPIFFPQHEHSANLGTAIQAATFLLLPHCAHLAILAATYCAAALTFNAITTGAP